MVRTTARAVPSMVYASGASSSEPPCPGRSRAMQKARSPIAATTSCQSAEEPMKAVQEEDGRMVGRAGEFTAQPVHGVEPLSRWST